MFTFVENLNLMKNFPLFFLFFVFSISVAGQNVVPLSDNLSLITNGENVPVENTGSVTKQINGMTINSKSYRINNGIENVSLHRLVPSGDNSYDYYSVNSAALSVPANAGNKDYDTLFFKLDDVYGLGFNPAVYIARPENTTGVYIPYWINDTLGYLTGIESDTLDIIAMLWKGLDFSIVFKYDYLFDHTDTVFLSDTMATHPVVLDPVDENGQSIFNFQGNRYSKFLMTSRLSSGEYFVSSWEIDYNTNYYISDYREGMEKIYFGDLLNCHYMGSFPSYNIQFAVPDTITDSVYLTNPPDSLVNVVSNFTYYHKRDYNNIGFGSMSKIKTANGYKTVGFLEYKQDYTHPYWEGSIHVYNTGDCIMRFNTQHYIDYIVNGANQFYIASPTYDIWHDSLAGYDGFVPRSDIHCFANYDTLFFGKGLVYYWNMWNNYSTAVYLKSDKMGMWGNWIYPNDREDTYILKDSTGNVVASGSGLEINVSISKAPYTLVQSNNFTHFNGFTGKTTITSELDFSKTDHIPPVASNIYFVNGNNTMKYQFESTEQIILRFSVADFTAYNNYHGGVGFHELPDSLTKVWVKKQNANSWLEAEVEKIYGDSTVGSVYETDLTDLISIDSALYDVKIYVEDSSGNSVTYVFRPAFVYGNFSVGIKEPGTAKPLKVVISPNPVRNVLNVKNIDDNCTYEIYSASGKEVLRGVMTNGKINVRHIAKGMYIIVFKTGDKKLASGRFVKSGL